VLWRVAWRRSPPGQKPVRSVIDARATTSVPRTWALDIGSPPFLLLQPAAQIGGRQTAFNPQGRTCTAALLKGVVVITPRRRGRPRVLRPCGRAASAGSFLGLCADQPLAYPTSMALSRNWSGGVISERDVSRSSCGRSTQRVGPAFLPLPRHSLAKGGKQESQGCHDPHDARPKVGWTPGTNRHYGADAPSGGGQPWSRLVDSRAAALHPGQDHLAMAVR
jgi:hypothetical protein